MSSVAPYMIAGIILLGFVPAQAESSTKPGKWLKTQRCELMLAPEVAELQGEHNYLNAVRAASAKLDNSLKTEMVPIGYDEFVMRGAIPQLSTKRKAKSVARLNALERDLVKGNPDMQIAAVELRGAQISKALNVISQLETSLAKEYADLTALMDGGLKTKIWSGAYRAFPFLPLGPFMFIMRDRPVSLTSGLIFMGLVTLPAAMKFIEYKHDQYRFDFETQRLRNFLLNQQGADAKDMFYHSATSLNLPTEFSRLIFNSKNPHIVQEGRVQTHYELGRPLSHMLGPKEFLDLVERDLIRAVTHAGDLRRYVHLDHIAYYDEQTGEPVWLFVYRSYTLRPQGSNPPREQNDQSTAPDWDRGLKPAGT